MSFAYIFGGFSSSLSAGRHYLNIAVIRVPVLISTDIFNSRWLKLCENRDKQLFTKVLIQNLTIWRKTVSTQMRIRILNSEHLCVKIFKFGVQTIENSACEEFQLQV